uniref:Uncharacterized protein n=1 Tax=Anopheles culicifacies TaxID=139723 RepID=A0A182LVZ3_9DIPT
MLTGALFTIGIAVLLVVVLAIRRKRDGHGGGLCDGKEKHIGMDITVTTPLEMGMGQQKYVVAYTLKQGVEKQPDILNAQKTGSASVQSIKDMGQKMGSPLGYNHNPPPLVDPYAYKSSPLGGIPGDNPQTTGEPGVASNPGFEYRSSSRSSSGNLKQAATTLNGAGNPEYRYSGSEFVTDLLDFSSAPSPSSGSTVGATLTKTRNRQHIITDTLPGPESCV